MPEPMPLILNDCSIAISTTVDETGLTALECLTTHVELTPEVSETELATMCGTRTYPGSTAWSLMLTLVQSFDPDATEEVLSAAVALGEPVPFEIIPYKSKPVGVDNPSWSGFVIPQPYAPIAGDAGEASEVELEWSLSGPPVKSTTPGVFAAGADAEQLEAAEAAAARATVAA